jgi:hypothetical protein
MRPDGVFHAPGHAPPGCGGIGQQRRIRRRAVKRPAAPDVRDSCGLKWQSGMPSWWIVISLLHWACRNNCEAGQADGKSH